MNTNLLTIAIPTFNRSCRLEYLLKKIVPVCEEKNINVLVANNASSDDTENIIDKYKRYKNFKNLRHQRNIEFDRNIIALLNNTTSKFVWLFGDDDDLCIEYLDEIVDLLKNNSEVGIFYVDYTYKKKILEKRVLDYEILNIQQYVNIALHKAGFISSNILNLDYYRKIDINAECISDGLIHLHIIINILHYLLKKQIKTIIIKNRIVMPGIREDPYSVELFLCAMIKKFIATINKSNIDGLYLEEFKKKYYELNIKPWIVRLGINNSFRQCFDIYRQVNTYFKISFNDKMRIAFKTILFRLFGYSLLKKIKDAIRI